MTFDISRLGDAFQKIGKTCLETGMFYGMHKMGTQWGSCFRMPPFFGGCFCGDFMGGSIFGMDNMSSSMPNPSLMGQAYGQGAALYNQISMLNAQQNMMMPGSMGMYPGMYPQTSLPQPQLTNQPGQFQSNGKGAVELDKNQQTGYGKQFADAMSINKNVAFVPEGFENADATEKENLYNESLIEFGKSYTMYMDKEAGDGDGTISLKEYQKYELKTAVSKDATLDEIKQANKLSEQSFETMDLNNDGKLDWLEMSSALSAYDANSDGKLTTEEIEAGNNNTLISPNNARTLFSTKYDELNPEDKA